MVSLTSLALPIVATAGGCFVASSVIWMCLPWHKGDYKAIPDEDGAMAAIRKLNLGKGLYCFPMGHHKDKAKQAAACDKAKTGPCGMISIRDNGFAMGKSLGIWFVNLLLITTVVAYLASLAVPAGADFMRVAQVVGSAMLLGMGGGLLTDIAWKGMPARNSATTFIDVCIYTAIACAAFGLLWPKA